MTAPALSEQQRIDRLKQEVTMLNAIAWSHQRDAATWRDECERAERQRDIALFALFNTGPLAADCVIECGTFAGHVPMIAYDCATCEK